MSVHDFAPYLAQVPRDVDAVYALLLGRSALQFMRQYQEFGLKGRVRLIGGGTTTEHLGVRSSYIYQLEELIQALRGGPPMPTGPDDAVATAQLIDQCYRAADLPLRPRKTLTPTDRRS